MDRRKTSLSPFVDLNSIPLAAIERIEILKDGASALYGADAVCWCDEHCTAKRL